MKSLFLFLLLFVSVTANAGRHPHRHYHHEVKRHGYYEYDVEGTRGDRVKHNIGRGLGKTVASPFLATRWAYRGSKRAVRSTSKKVEFFLSDAARVDGDKRALHDVLLGWENSDDLASIIERERKQGHRFMFGLPNDAWKLLKATLYMAGYRLPRGGWHVLRGIVIGSGHTLGIL